jgi:hypothetical protein
VLPRLGLNLAARTGARYALRQATWQARKQAFRAARQGARSPNKVPCISQGVNRTAARFGNAASTDYRATFFNANPKLQGAVRVHHAVEQQVLKRYPGVVSEAEMHSLQNLRGIPNELNGKLHLSDIRKAWNQFYRNNPNATSRQLLDEATRIDDLYGHLFRPPVR